MNIHWWGTADLAEGTCLERQIGPFSFAIRRTVNELQLYYDYLLDWQDESEMEYCVPDRFIEPENLKERYILEASDNTVTLLPVLADRPVIVQPATPFYIPGKQRAKIFVSTPLWVRIHYGSNDTWLNELAVQRPSDTWFGSNTMEGELCYASQTSARLDAGKLPIRFHRVTTIIHVDNESDTRLLLERVNLPVPFLGIYEDEAHRLWTQAVRISKNKNNETAALQIIPGPPPEATGALLLSDAREQAAEKTIIRKLSGFFG